jgi:hypothetical protein
MSDSPWTSYNPSLGRPLLNTEKFLSPRKTSPPDESNSKANGQPHEAQQDSSEVLEETALLPGLDPGR